MKTKHAITKKASDDFFHSFGKILGEEFKEKRFSFINEKQINAYMSGVGDISNLFMDVIDKAFDKTFKIEG